MCIRDRPPTTSTSPSRATSPPRSPSPPSRSYAEVAAAVSSLTRLLPLAGPLDLVSLAQEQSRLRGEFQHLRGEESSLVLQFVKIPGTNTDILCDTSNGIDRPLVPSSTAKAVFDHFHGLSHASGRSTLRDIRARFVWHRMSSDVLRWARSCPGCAASKISSCLLYTSPSPRDLSTSRMPSSA